MANPTPPLHSIEDHRRIYAKFVVMQTGSADERLIAAFSSVERERFLGKGPWSIVTANGYLPTLSDDPRFVYQDVAIGLMPDRHINNGQPSLHARCLAACAPAAGEVILHVGAGAGYYTAMLASLTGPNGKVVAYEIDAGLAGRARENLNNLSNVFVENASASEGTLPGADVIYVNAGATHPLPAWLDALKPGGRLIFPLTGSKSFGVMLLITRNESDSFAARMVTPAAFIGCTGGRDNAASELLDKAFQSWPLAGAKSLHRETAPDATACYAGNGWWLSTAEPGKSQ